MVSVLDRIREARQLVSEMRSSRQDRKQDRKQRKAVDRISNAIRSDRFGAFKKQIIRSPELLNKPDTVGRVTLNTAIELGKERYLRELLGLRDNEKSFFEVWREKVNLKKKDGGGANLNYYKPKKYYLARDHHVLLSLLVPEEKTGLKAVDVAFGASLDLLLQNSGFHAYRERVEEFRKDSRWSLRFYSDAETIAKALNDLNVVGLNAIGQAIADDAVDKVLKLVDFGAEIIPGNLEQELREEDSAKTQQIFLIAAEKGSPNTLRAAIQKGVDLYAKNQSGKTVEELVCESGNEECIKTISWLNKFLEDCKTGELQHPFSEYFTEAGIELYDFVDENGNTPLLYSAMSGCDAAHRLIKCGVSLDRKGKYDYTALMYAAENNNVELIVDLLKNGADPKIRKYAYYGEYAAVKYAIIEGHIEATRAIIDNSESVGKEMLNKFLATSLLYSQRDIASELIEKGAVVDHHCVYRLAAKGHVDMFDFLIVNGHWIPQNLDDLLKPALGNGRSEMLNWLIDNGVDIHRPSALVPAIEGRFMNLAYNIILQGADLSDGKAAEMAFRVGKVDLCRDIVQKDSRAATAGLLYEAARKKDSGLVEFLVEKGADLSDGKAAEIAFEAGDVALCRYIVQKDSRAATAGLLYEAVRKNDSGLAEFLVEKGADFSDGKAAEIAFETGKVDLCMSIVQKDSRAATADLLYAAVLKNDYNFVGFLAEQGAEMNPPKSSWIRISETSSFDIKFSPIGVSFKKYGESSSMSNNLLRGGADKMTARDSFNEYDGALAAAQG